MYLFSLFLRKKEPAIACATAGTGKNMTFLCKNLTFLTPPGTGWVFYYCIFWTYGSHNSGSYASLLPPGSVRYHSCNFPESRKEVSRRKHSHTLSYSDFRQCSSRSAPGIRAYSNTDDIPLPAVKNHKYNSPPPHRQRLRWNRSCYSASAQMHGLSSTNDWYARILHACSVSFTSFTVIAFFSYPIPNRPCSILRCWCTHKSFPDFSQHRADFQFKFFPQDPTFHPFFSVIPCCKYSIDFCFRH